MNQDSKSLEFVRWLVTIIVPAASGFIGVLVGALLATRREKFRARLEFCTRQLREFYSPLLAIREEIRVLIEFREKVHAHGHDVWQELCEVGRSAEESEVMKKLLEPERAKLNSHIEYDNAQLREKLLPAYSRMVQHFRDNYWLADPESRHYYHVLIEYVEGWSRFLSQTHSSEVLQRVNTKEEKLLPFYKHLHEIHDSLRDKVRRGKTR